MKLANVKNFEMTYIRLLNYFQLLFLPLDCYFFLNLFFRLQGSHFFLEVVIVILLNVYKGNFSYILNRIG